jgi:chorismate mutase
LTVQPSHSKIPPNIYRTKICYLPLAPAFSIFIITATGNQLPLVALNGSIFSNPIQKCEANGLALFLYLQEVGMPVQGIRGAAVAESDQPEAILAATRDLLRAILKANPALQTADLASVIFTVSPDLSSAYPAQAARQLGWSNVPMLCMQEIPVPGGLAHCVRVLLHWNTDLAQGSIRHVYLGAAATLRPDLSPKEP